MKVRVSTSVDPGYWDSLVASSPEGSIFQTATWALFLNDYLGVKSFFFLVENTTDAKPVALLRASRESPFHRLVFERPLNRFTIPLADRLSAHLSWEAGPVFLTAEGKSEALTLLLEAVEKLCRDQGIVALQGAWPGIYSLEKENQLDQVWLSAGYCPEQRSTFLVDLRADEQTLWRNLKSSARKSIRRTVEQGLTVRRITEPGELSEYHDFLCRCREALGLATFSLRNLTEMWRVLFPAGMLEIFYIRYRGALAGGLGIWHHAGVIYEWGSLQAPEAKELKLYCSDLLKWEVIRWGHSKGCRLYDLAGVVTDPSHSGDKERGIYQFKAKWGGKQQRFPAYSKCFKPFRHALLKEGAKVFRKLRERF